MTAAASDLVALAKPRITALVVFTTAIGLWLAPHGLRPLTVALTLVGTVLIVAAANVLNMYLERDSDALMARTMNRPLPAHRMEIGALPGAIPPLIGWTAATERLDLPGVLLFAVMFLWQVPHFLAITLFRKEEYARAGLVVQPNEPGGEREARANIVRYTVALVAVSLLFVPIGIARGAYLASALLLGGVFLGYAVAGLRQAAGRRWARNLFLLSLIYLPLLFGALLLDRRV
ncbi:MAG: protoheme IX farnesyltransferase [Deltaproteobacteria bacterium]|nr:MAG: protoheme IX farnesyltransferase [Deltaproteobacteria bacterium]